jgi:hypothetical protein
MEFIPYFAYVLQSAMAEDNVCHKNGVRVLVFGI